MNDTKNNFKKFIQDIENAKDYFIKHSRANNSSIRIYTHLDSDGLTAGAILGKALYRESIPFQMTILRQLEKEEILKIAENEFDNFLIFSDFGSGQYLELQKELLLHGYKGHFIILDHHLPQKISDKNEIQAIEEIHIETSPWHINPYFNRIDGSTEISGAGISYYFAKSLNSNNIDLSSVAIVGAVGDIQNQGPHKSFIGINSLILEEAKSLGLVEIIDDLNFSPIKPLNEAIAYSSDIKLPGLTNDPNKTLKFLKTLGILMEDSEGKVRTLSDIDKDEKQKIASAIIEYATLKLDIEPNKIIQKLIVNRYLLTNENNSELHDAEEFSNLLNACGRTNNASLGIAIAMGDRQNSFQQAKESLSNYKKSLHTALSWIKKGEKIQQKKNFQYFFGEDVITENIVGTVSTMLILGENVIVDKNKPIFGCALRENEDVYKISGRAHEKIVNKGVNLSDAIREALEMSNLEALGGGHPPAAGTKVPINKIDLFLENLDEVIQEQIK